VVSSTPRLHFTPEKDTVPIVQEAGWDPGPVWTSAKTSPLSGFDPRAVQPVAQSLYRLIYPAHKDEKVFMCSHRVAYDACVIVYVIVQTFEPIERL
jgi:hypothetical protein